MHLYKSYHIHFIDLDLNISLKNQMASRTANHANDSLKLIKVLYDVNKLLNYIITLNTNFSF